MISVLSRLACRLQDAGAGSAMALSRTRTCDTCSKPYFEGKTCASCHLTEADRDLMLWIIGVEIALLFLALAS